MAGRDLTPDERQAAALEDIAKDIDVVRDLLVKELPQLRKALVRIMQAMEAEGSRPV